MKNNLTLLSCILITAFLTGCGNSESPFTEGGVSSGTNIITEKNFVMAFDEPNPKVIDSDGYHSDVEVVVSISASDKLLLSTSGATAYLDVDWGTLSSNTCQIISGSCTITWTGDSSFNQPYFPGDGDLNTNDELITFTAWVLGEESFSDLNGNGIFDDSDIFDNDTSGPFLDLDFSGTFSAGDKILFPGNANGTLTAADGLYNGAECSHSTLCNPTTTEIYISDRAILSIVDGVNPP